MHGVFEPTDLRIIQEVYDRMASEPWFSDGVSYREEFARYVLGMYRRGLVIPEKLEALCKIAAWKKFRATKSIFEGFRFLIVEDDYLMAREATERLTVLGAEIAGPVPSVAEAVDLVEHGHELDGALLDINLGGQTVYPVAAMLKMKQVPFAFVTAYEDRVLPAFFRSTKVFTKPASWETIVSDLARERIAYRSRIRPLRRHAS
ncbi:hypothetical protein ATY81_25355 [Rhizobium sp. R72]|uniref:response regulator n=1 Tax=unclassified Rhizobium TaxID=2613769 RepID=UPI000B5334DE|nr:MULTISPECIES: response regulator [unclassified Rhizobium]OWW00122.1 hypothetical protein ATY81_25355 [Rhizobium sp. R72]OWW00513.1 hypothetical protein ATY80_25355 [Rhizobium sp. R711]